MNLKTILPQTQVHMPCYSAYTTSSFLFMIHLVNTLCQRLVDFIMNNKLYLVFAKYKLSYSSNICLKKKIFPLGKLVCLQEYCPFRMVLPPPHPPGIKCQMFKLIIPQITDISNYFFLWDQIIYFRILLI